MSISLCVLHSTHENEPEIYDGHHVLPLSWQGPTPLKDPTTIAICPDGHREIHVAIDALVASGGEDLPYAERHKIGTSAYLFARKAFDEAAALGLTPKRTL